NLRTQLNQYSALKNSLQAIQRKREGNLSVRSLYGIVNRDQCVSDSEYLQTLFVAVPKNLKREWANKYETLADMVVPRSCTRIDEDDEFALYSVVVMKRAVGDFTSKARENKFTVREFNYSEEEAAEERENAMDVEEQEGSKFQQLREWIQTNFSDMFSAWLHIKALRAFVESVLRYGLSVDFVAVLINMTSRNLQKTIKALKDTYGYLEDNTNSSSAAARNSVRKGKSDAAIGSGDAFDMHEFSTVLDETYTPFPLFNIEWSFDRDAN
ncbi:Vacuolar ATP synthase subunit C, partial [Spiromyces aspiralis]